MNQIKNSLVEQAALCIMTKDTNRADDRVSALIKVVEKLIITEKKVDYTYEDYVRYIKEALFNKGNK